MHNYVYAFSKYSQFYDLKCEYCWGWADVLIDEDPNIGFLYAAFTRLLVSVRYTAYAPRQLLTVAGLLCREGIQCDREEQGVSGCHLHVHVRPSSSSWEGS